MPVGRCKSSSAKDRTAVHAARQSAAAMFPHPPDVSRARAARWVRCAPDETTRHAPGRPDPARARRLRRRARLLLRDLPAQRLHRARDPRGDGPGQPLALAPRRGARDARLRRARRGQARALRARGDLRRPRRRAPRVADLRPVGGLRPQRREHAPALRAGRLRPRLLRAQRHGRRALQAGRATTSPTSTGPSSTTIPRSAIEWPLPPGELVPSQRDLDAPLLRDVADGLPFEYR